MSQSYLTYTLYAPLSSWGTTKQNKYTRPTDMVPSRSALIGMIYAAKGVPREDVGEHEPDYHDPDVVDLSLRIDNRGMEMKDFLSRQGVGSPSSPNSGGTDTNKVDVDTIKRYKTRRAFLERIYDRASMDRPSTGKLGSKVRGPDHNEYPVEPDDLVECQKVDTLMYVQDGLYSIALGADDDLIERMRRWLFEPHYNLFLGRKSCPLGLHPQPSIDRDADSGLDALKRHDPFEAFRTECVSDDPIEDVREHLTGRTPNRILFAWDDDQTDHSPDETVRRHDRTIDPDNHMYAYRDEHRCFLDPTDAYPSHD